MISEQRDRSIDVFRRAQRVTPGGVQSGSRYREPHPWYFSSASGAWLTDVEGRAFLDCIMGNGAVMLGHGRQEVVEAVTKTIEQGLTCGVETELAVRAAESLMEKLPGTNQIRFANTGTEAALHCIRIARAATGRRKIAKFEGAYHGWADPVLVSAWPDLSKAGPPERPRSLAASGGILADTVTQTISLPFNNLQAVETILREEGEDVAAIILEPAMIDIGYVGPEPGFLQGLRALAAELGIVLIFDELLTGFRLAPGGAQEFFGVEADLTMLGKAIANGFPVSVVAGKPHLMALVRPGGPVAFQGTFNGHSASLAAIIAVMDLLEKEDVLVQLQNKTELLQKAFADLCQRHGVHAYLAGRGGHIHPYFVEEPVRDFREAAQSDRTRYLAFASALIERQIYCYANPLLHHAISLAHGDRELELLVDAMDQGLSRAARIDT